jgi:hypothetical protein
MSGKVVEFSGPKSETVTVRLVDGTALGSRILNQDPRSPLGCCELSENRVPSSLSITDPSWPPQETIRSGGLWLLTEGNWQKKLEWNKMK